MHSTFACFTAVVATLLLSFQGTPKTDGEEKLAYPTFEPFVASRMFKVIAGDLDKVDLAELAQQFNVLADTNKTSKDAAERITGKPPKKEPSAALEPQIPADARPLYALLPIVMMKLAPLWDAPTWSAEQTKLARDGATIVGRLAGAPALAFVDGKHAENRAALEQLVRWYRATAAKPECYAAMIFTMDDGPFVGLPYATTEALTATATHKLDEHTELRLAKVERPKEPWVLQCVRDGKPLWSRVISAAPDESVAEVAFANSPPLKVGPYGWKVFLRVTWSYGNEQAHLYVDAKANLLFYYLSW